MRIADSITNNTMLFHNTAASGMPADQNAAPEDTLSITCKQLTEVEKQVAEDMKILNQTQHKYSSIHTWTNRLGGLSATAGRISMPAFIASIATSLAASFLAIPALGTLAGLTGTVCTASFVTWIGALGASKLSEYAEKKTEKDIPQLTMKVQTENKEAMDLRNRIQYLRNQVQNNDNAVDITVKNKKPEVKTGEKTPDINTNDFEDDEVKKPVLEVTDYDEGTISIGGIIINKNN